MLFATTNLLYFYNLYLASFFLLTHSPGSIIVARSGGKSRKKALFVRRDSSQSFQECLQFILHVSGAAQIASHSYLRSYKSHHSQ